ncbi:MAG: TldD/PmbA family protein [Nanoarchaeota archaeon]
MINKINNYIKSKAKKYELYYVESESLNSSLGKKSFDYMSEGKSSGFGIRVVIDNKIGCASSFDVNNYKECIDKAIAIAKVSNKDKSFKDFAFPDKYKRIVPYKKELLSFNAEDLCKLNTEIINKIKSYNKGVELTRGFYSKIISKIRIINTNGIDFEHKLATNSIGYELKLNNEVMEFGEDSVDFLTINKLDKRVKECVDRLNGLFGKKRVNSGEMQLLLHPNALRDLLDNTFEFSINAENVQKKKSIFINKLNKKIADEKLTIVDNGLKPGLINTRSADDEGVPSQKIVIIKNGVLKNFVYDTYTANIENKKSTGNAFRSVDTTPKIATTNLILNKGNKTEEQLLSMVDEGLYVKYLLGGHTMNQATGDFSLGMVEGHYVKDGEIKFPVKDAMLVGNFYELIKKVEAIGKEIKYYGNGYYAPLILFPKIKIVGG